MLSCKQASQLLSQSLDRGLLRRERIGLVFHLMLCSMCRRFGRQIEAMRKMVRRLRQQIEQDEAVRLPAEAQQRIAHVLATRHMHGK
ncbi:MAG TPA: zf-HC2 domain-containing protein [Methylophilaceae bacterium]|nr:zf-HC2 domain-containing protein [Methylophilaceae bacterium]